MKDLWSAELNYTYNKSKDSSITFFSIGTRIDAVSHLNYSIDTLFYNHSHYICKQILLMKNFFLNLNLYNFEHTSLIKKVK